MKRFWQTCIAVFVTTVMANTASAQMTGAGQIGSYQAVLARAGYGSPAGTQLSRSTPVGYKPGGKIPMPPGVNRSLMQGPDGRLGPLDDPGTDFFQDAGGDSPVYDPATSACGETCETACDSGANWVVGFFGVNYRRDYENNVRLGWNGAGTDLYSRDVENGNMGGGGVTFSRRDCCGFGTEATFWGLDEEDSLYLAGPTYTYLTGLANVAHPPSGVTVEDIFNAGDNVRLFRDTDIFDFEFNLLRNVGEYKTRTGRCGNFELLAGFRLFNFDESLRYVNYSSAAGYPATLEYSLEGNNSLAGFQLGGRSEVCLTNRWRFSFAGTAGAFNNHIETQQEIFDETGYWAMNHSDTKNDAAFLGQIDLGLIYQVSQRARARVGYRAIGVSGVALAANQIPYDFTNTTALESADSSGELILYGFYYGGEFCF